MRHWTVIDYDSGECIIDCSCGWSTFTNGWEDAVQEARWHKENADV